MRHRRERQILDDLRAFVQDIITDAISDLPARAEEAPAQRAPARKPTSTTQHLSPMQARIVDAVRDGFKTVPEIARELDTSAGSARAQLGRLARAGTLRRVARGVYEVAPGVAR